MGADGARPPGPRGHWLAGNLKAYEDDRLGFLLDMRDQYGDVVAFDGRTAIVNSGPLARRMLLDRDHALAMHENFLQDRITVEAGVEAVALRRLLSPGLRESACPDLLPGLVRRIDDEAAVWTSGQAALDPTPLLERAIATSVAEHYFNPGGGQLAPLLTDLLNALSRTILDPFVLPWRSLSPARRESWRRYHLVATEVHRLLEQRANDAKCQDLASAIVAADAGQTPISRLADLVIGSMLAAQRVPAAASSWVLMHVAENPHLWPELRTEAADLDERLRSASLSSVRASDFPIAMACVLEALRLQPPTWLITRRSVRDVELAGYRFRAGQHFMISPYVIHRDDREFPDSADFEADRWLHSSVPPGTYLPFGHGQHVCPGRHLAVLAITVVLLRVMNAGTLHTAPGKVTPNPRTTLLPDGLRLRCQPWSTHPETRPNPAAASLSVAG